MDKELKKYKGSSCGNSFVIVDCRGGSLDRKEKIDFARTNIVKYGADSALFISESEEDDVCMEIFEKDGSESDFCGNGAILIAYMLGLDKGFIRAKNQVVVAEGDSEKQSIIMDIELSQVEEMGDDICIFVRMGEPHMIFLAEDVQEFDLIGVGSRLQNDYPEGVNVDALQRVDNHHYLIRTYERGVCAETKSCGTGAMSSYIAVSYFRDKLYTEPVEFKSVGGCHSVSIVDGMVRLEVQKSFCEFEEI